MPTYLEYLAGAEEHGLAGEATLLRYALTRMVLGSRHAETRLEAREFLLIYQAMMGRTEQSATRCLAKCVQALQRQSRAVTEPLFRELEVELWLLARWDAALERNDHDDLWEQTGIWLCGPAEDAAAKVADALMISPEGERWVRILGSVDERVDDLARAMTMRPELLRWAEGRTRTFIEQNRMNPRVPLLLRMIGGNEELTILAEQLREEWESRWR